MPRLVIPTVITTERLRLEVPTLERAESIGILHRANRERALLGGFNPEYFATTTDTRKWVEIMGTAHAQNYAYMWNLYRTESPQTPIGTLGAYGVQPHMRPLTTSLGYFIDLGNEGQGLMQEALAAAVETLETYGFQTHLDILASNQNSLRLANRLGYINCGMAGNYIKLQRPLNAAPLGMGAVAVG